MNEQKFSVSVLGLGYIGLPTALLLANSTVSVSGFDISDERKNILRSGKLPFEEHGLDELFASVQAKHTFTVSDAVVSSDYYIVSVPTPQTEGRADLSYVIKAIESIKTVFSDNQTIIIESTIGPRDCIDKLIPIVQSWGIPFHFAHCPERAIPGNTLHEMVTNDRIIGGDTDISAKKVKELYGYFVNGPIHCTDTIVAASCKVMENTYRAVNIALANEFAQLAQELKFDVWEAINLANKHPRVHIHNPGPGVGGHCIPIDPWFFVGNSAKATLIETALKKNEHMSDFIFSTLKGDLERLQIAQPTIGILGYAYKKNVDDARETPAQALYETLSKEFPVIISDPFVHHSILTNEEEVLQNASVIIIATDHDHYRNLDFHMYPNIVYIYDTRHCLTREQIDQFTGTYALLGRNTV